MRCQRILRRKYHWLVEQQWSWSKLLLCKLSIVANNEGTLSIYANELVTHPMHLFQTNGVDSFLTMFWKIQQQQEETGLPRRGLKLLLSRSSRRQYYTSVAADKVPFWCSRSPLIVQGRYKFVLWWRGSATRTANAILQMPVAKSDIHCPIRISVHAKD